ncbi:MAG: DNA polymerase III subunit gamma/tau [Chitinophagaceae bacterium]|nr:DNA polymerase III subunit gamma/tau [Chitinophagaceae bacterium]
MDNFIVSARKYRPKGFEEVVGQEHITTTLTNAIKTKHIGQAMLFCGPRGVGKTTCARIFARMINEFDTQESIYEAAHLNIYELDAASNNSVDDIRNLTEQVRYPPQKGKYKVYIIDEVHMLSNQAFNAFLKTLEEPPSYAIFILATTEKHKVIPTILSRCQIYDFKRIEIRDIVKQLQTVAEKENIKTEEEALHLIASKADGALRDALSLFDLIATFSLDNSITYKNTVKNLHIIDYEYYFKITDFYNNQNITDILLLYDEVLQYGFEGQNFILGLMQHFRNLFICKHPETISLLNTSETVKLQYKTQAQATTSAFLFSAMDILSQADIYYKTSKNQRLHVELALIKIYKILTEPNEKETSNEEEGLKKKRV